MNPSFLLILLLFLPASYSQTIALSEQQIAMEKLSFLIGKWEGRGISYDDKGNTSSYFDTEKVWFDVQNSLLIIQANGFKDDQPFYGIHTVIYYDINKQHYWYNPYTATGARAFECHLDEQVFKCYIADKTFRLTFQLTEKGQWNEFGERLVNGSWQKTFETVLGRANDT